MEKSIDKFQHLLHKFLEEEHQVIDDTCLEKLLTHLSVEGNGSRLFQLEESRMFCERSLQAYEKGLIKESVLSFALRLHGHLIQNEAYFSSSELQESTKKIAESPRFLITDDASIQYSYVQMVSGLLVHACGTDWLVKYDVWKKIQKLYEKNHSVYVSKECQNFLSNLIMNLEKEPEKMKNMLEIPLNFLCSSNRSNFNLGSDLLIKVLELAFKSGKHEISELLKQQVEKSCDDLITSVKDTTSLVKVARILALLTFALTDPSLTDLVLLEEKILSIIARLIDTKNISAIQMTLLQCQTYYCILKPKISHLSVKYKLDHQLIYIQVMQLLQKDLSEIKKECARNFLEKLCSETTEATKLQGCRLRNVVLFSGDPKLYACRAMHSVVQMRDIMAREIAVLVFRSLMCNVIHFIEANSEEISEFQDSGLISTTLESIMTLIDHFHFTWRESIETTCLLTFMQELLCEPAIGHRQTSQILQVMRRSIEGFMPPNLALLMNTLEDTPLQNLGPQLFRCLHNVTWEVRDSALEVLSVMAKISNDKFPAFQNHLLEHKLCSLAVSMAVGDEESYVRVSALNCLYYMVAVPAFWERCLHKEGLPSFLTTILYQESEGLVRREAASVVSAMLQYKRFTDEECDRMNIVMASVVANDLHWEVKTNAIDYWLHTIQQRMSEEGMLDGKFPSVTFSGPQRKIVTLDTREVQTRLQRILVELSKTRCLAVLISALHDPDLQVARKVADIISNLQNLLKEHGLLNIQQNQPPGFTAVVSTVETPSLIQTEKHENSEQVIDGIVGQTDLKLLASVYRSQMSLEATPPCEVRKLSLLSPEQFLQALSVSDVNDIITVRSEWLQGCSDHLDSLLTDMLEAREFQHNTNDIDCY